MKWIPGLDRKAAQDLKQNPEEARHPAGPLCPDPAENLIRVRDLTKHYRHGFYHPQITRAVDGVSFDISGRETFGLVGESGCGKSTLASCLLRLDRPTAGRIFYRGKDINSPDIKLKQLRKKVQIIFQDADGSLNPRMKIRDLLLEPLKIHGQLVGSNQDRAEELLALVNLSPELLDRRPFQLSGGQRQRIGLARAISLNPELIVADEATASLDQLVRAQIMALLKKLRVELGVSYLFISHNLDLVRQLADRLAIMYLGRFVETGRADRIFSGPLHPYTRILISSIPRLDGLNPASPVLSRTASSEQAGWEEGCAFYPRCPSRRDICLKSPPRLKTASPDHEVACHLTGCP